ncbi:hypothetical protein EPUS_01107 [Endocarpon pusillum Z07020]|uniref:Conserved oligomeric Golgi complex subunit 1 n=1 Tax=Endocarpon pusillum (strain Z07020 / HMAS-L-300199) TaxID=1263415 RepID=U1GBV4_ENDPU|nr:uncharacterized protein EPUS_01107 [Endocarpon pusillum Z07020]ERF69151.1 hypothetical protein EPUS_01107 [Endocarpon pusillum Z07020]
MASAGSDARALKSWEEAFTYPIATTRQIEKQLRNDIAANKERLRTLVGSSYRDLLGTADRIIQLDHRMQETEELMGEVSLQCNSDVIDKKARHLAQLQEQAAQQKSGGRQLAAQLSLLQKCHKCLPRLFRRGGSVLTAAKVLAVSRLLTKRIGQEDNAPPLLNLIKEQLTSQRRRLLRRVDLILISPESSLHQLIEAICAFCIVTSSSSNDAIRHFQDLRLDEIRRLSDASEKGREGVLEGFHYYLQSLRTTPKLFGRQFSDAMRDLRGQPLLRSTDIESLEELDLAKVQQFIPTEILSFVPWIKHTDSPLAEAPSILGKWSNAAFEDLCLALKRTANELSDTSELLNFRKQALEVWLPLSSSTSTHSNAEIFQALRSIFNTRIKGLLHARAGSLSVIASDIESVLEEGGDDTTPSCLSIWDHDLATASLGKGASTFKRRLIDRHLGHSKTTTLILASLQRWTAAMSNSLEQIEQVRTTRWIDFIEEDEDVDDDGDGDDKTETIERTLQKDDPDQYEHEHKSSLDTATLEFQSRIKAAVETLHESETPKAIFLLRTIRGIYHHMTSSSIQQQDLPILASAIPRLHHLLATNTTSTLLGPIHTSSSLVQRHKIKALARLWEGDPPLPTHPSPPVFKLLQRLTGIMADQGPDLWSGDAVEEVKRAVRKEIVERKLLPLETKVWVNGTEEKPKLANGTTDDGDGRKADRQTSTQVLFDVFYLLLHALELRGESGSDAVTSETLIRHLKDSVSRHLDAAAMTALESRAKDYWARTSLLFGLLA